MEMKEKQVCLRTKDAHFFEVWEIPEIYYGVFENDLISFMAFTLAVL